ncbi:hypothetical protein D9M73_257830 [compost metagenome]
MDAGAGAAVPVALRSDHARHHGGMLALLPGGGAVLAIAGHVEHGTVLDLQVEGLADQLLAAGKVLARGQNGKGLLAGKQRVARMGGGHGYLLVQSANGVSRG